MPSIFKPEPLAPNASIVGGGKDTPYRITVLTAGLVRLEYAADGLFEDRPSTLALNRNQPTPSFRVVGDTLPPSDHTAQTEDLEVITDRFHLRYDKRPFSPEGLTLQVKGGVTDWHSVWRFSVPDTPYFSLGGTARTLDEADGRIALGSGVVSRSGYALLDDSASALFTEDAWIAPRRPSPPSATRHDLYIFSYGRDYGDAVRALYALAGPQPLLPRWALGNWWSRYFAYDDAGYRSLVTQFSDARIPLAVGVVDMDWHWTEAQELVRAAGASGWSGYSFNRQLFPNPPEFTAWLHSQGLRVALCDHPADGIARYEDVYAEACVAAGMNPATGDPVPFDPTSRRLMSIYFEIALGNLERTCATDFWWVDWQQGPYSKIKGIDPLWVLIHFHFLRNASAPDGSTKRPMTFARYAGPGSHRYPIGFSGDTIVNWDSLAFQPEFTASASNVGYGFWSHDIGGHMAGYRDSELLVRWVQLGVFSPIFRLHSSNNIFNNKEPWTFKAPYADALRDAMQLRHRLIPYIYTHCHLTAAGDLPLIRPAYWTHADRDEAYRNKTTFWFGDSLLVAPLVSPMDKSSQRASARVWLPPGRMVDLFSGIVYDGDREILLHRTLDEFAVLVKTGSLIPMDAAGVLENDARNPTDMEVKVIVGADGAFILHEDDGSGSTLEEVAIAKTPMTFKQATGKLRIGPVQGPGIAALPRERNWKITFPSLHEDAATGLKAKEKTCITKSGSFCVCRDKVSVTAAIEIDLGANPQLAVNNVKQRVYDINNDAQMSFNDKNVVWDAIGAGKLDMTLSVALARLRAGGVDAAVSAAVEEIMCADARAWTRDA